MGMAAVLVNSELIKDNKHHKFPRVFYSFRYTFSVWKIIQSICMK